MFFPWFFLEKIPWIYLPSVTSFFYGKMVYSSLILLLQELTYPENPNHFQFGTNHWCFWITFHFFNIHSLAFFHASQALKKRCPSSTDVTGWSLNGRNSAGSWLSGSLWAWVSSSAPSRQAIDPPVLGITASHFDKQQQVTRFCHLILGKS